VNEQGLLQLAEQAEADSLDAQISCLEHAVKANEDAEHVVRHNEQLTSEIRQLNARLRSVANDWRSEARRLRIAADDGASQ
jgi:hypothetical protein